jgi:hypothetical protein
MVMRRFNIALDVLTIAMGLYCLVTDIFGGDDTDGLV